MLRDLSPSFPLKMYPAGEQPRRGLGVPRMLPDNDSREHGHQVQGHEIANGGPALHTIEARTCQNEISFEY